MSPPPRTLLRLRRIARENVATLRRAPPIVVLVSAIALVSVLLVETTGRKDWGAVLQGFASNVVAAVILAAFAFAIFVLRFRRARVAEYLERFKRRDDASASPPTQLATTIVDELLTARVPRSCLLISEADIARTATLGELPPLLAARSVVPITVELRNEEQASGIAALAKETFVRGLVGSAGDEASGARVFASLLARRKAVVILRGLETWQEGLSIPARQASIAGLLKACLTEGLAFVAALPDELAPSIPEIAVLRIPTVSRAELADHMTRVLAERGLPTDATLEQALARAFAELREPTRDPWFLGLAADLLVARVLRGEDAAAAAVELFADPRAFRRHLRWMCEWSLACELDDVPSVSSAAAFALRTIGLEAHYRQDLPTSWADAIASLDTEGGRRFAAGFSMLSRRRVVTVSGGRDAVVRFGHAGWLSFAGALGFGLDEKRWQDLLRPGVAQTTLEALSAALVLNGSSAFSAGDSFLDVLVRLQGTASPEISLDMALAVITALQVDDEELVLGGEEVDVLRRSWLSAPEPVQLAFVTNVDFRRDQLLVEFLWHDVILDRRTPYGVTRAACETLASIGDFGWATLGPAWTELTKTALTKDLSSEMRKSGGDWTAYGYPIAVLSWTLPSLVLRIRGDSHRDAIRVLADLRRLVLGKQEAAAAPLPDVGLEISLAEGFKIAAAAAAESGETAAAWWTHEVEDFDSRARSWASRQVLLQALALAGQGGATIRRAADRGAAGTHALVRETAALALRSFEGGPATATQLRDIWLDDTRALEDGGLDLEPAAHRLLAISTLLINLAENAFARSDGASVRETVLTAAELPPCFCRRGHTATMFDARCDCPFDLCGPETGRQVGFRRFSQAFIRRAELTSRTPIASAKNAFSRQTFQNVWRDLGDRYGQGVGI